MALPVDYNTVNVRGRYVYLDGTPVQGSIRFTGKVVATSAATDTIIVPASITVQLDANGQFSVDLPATDDPDILPGGWTYRVTEQFTGGGGRTFEMDVPIAAQATGIDLSDVAPTGPSKPGDPNVFVTLTAFNETLSEIQAVRTDAPNTFTKSITIQSSAEGGEDDGTGFDSTSRLNLESYQRAGFASFGEVIRIFLRKAKAKAMAAWYFPQGGYDANGDPVGTFKPVVWIGAHWRSNDGLSLHKHWSVETPDSTGALQTRLEIPFGDPTVDNAVAGLDKTTIKTNQADLVVRCTNGQELRLAATDSHPKRITFSLDSDGGEASRRWQIEASSSGAHLLFKRYNDAGTFVDTPLFMNRNNGRVGIATNDPTVRLDVNDDRIRIRNPRTPATSTSFGNQGEIAWDDNYIYVCVAQNTWKRAPLSTW